MGCTMKGESIIPFDPACLKFGSILCNRTVHDKMLNAFRLDRDRPHDLHGFRARLAATVSLHNFCIWLNLQLGRNRLAFAELLDW